jgi:hypothetical protein
MVQNQTHFQRLFMRMYHGCVNELPIKREIEERVVTTIEQVAL